MIVSPTTSTAVQITPSIETEPVTFAPARTMQISPLIAAGSRFPVGTGNPDDPTALSPVQRRTFLMRGAEPSPHSPVRMGATPKATSGYDGTKDDDSEEFNAPDFSRDPPRGRP